MQDTSQAHAPFAQHQIRRLLYTQEQHAWKPAQQDSCVLLFGESTPAFNTQAGSQPNSNAGHRVPGQHKPSCAWPTLCHAMCVRPGPQPSGCPKHATPHSRPLRIHRAAGISLQTLQMRAHQHPRLRPPTYTHICPPNHHLPLLQLGLQVLRIGQQLRQLTALAAGCNGCRRQVGCRGGRWRRRLCLSCW